MQGNNLDGFISLFVFCSVIFTGLCRFERYMAEKEKKEKDKENLS